ncbi:MAG TPA: YicC/YloC family endoribonuclease [Alphaproteobacteria bacterium]|nr:YicC/YloC family endoribonuclease [Alphaproteobacteria bacterium]
MTGFASADGGMGDVRWTWDLKSVNGRGLDVRCRLPATLEGLEGAVRSRIQENFRRGSITAALTLIRPPGAVRLRLNQAVVDQLEEIIEALSVRVKADTPRLDALLGIKGVMETVEEEETAEARSAREEAILATLDAALAALARARAQEGEKLASVLAGHLEAAEHAAARAGASATLQPEAIKARLAAQVASLLEASPALPADRLAQEAALLAVRADVREELDRLRAHLSAARELLEQGGAIGRRLDFLCQELNREANTICSKSADIELTRTGLELKAVIEQLREQVQNIE